MATQIRKIRDPDLNLEFGSIVDPSMNDLTPDERRLLGAAKLSEAILQDAAKLDRKHRSKSNGRKFA